MCVNLLGDTVSLYKQNSNTEEYTHSLRHNAICSIVLKGVVQVNTWFIFFKNRATTIRSLGLVLQLSPMEVNGNKLQYHVQPVHRCLLYLEESSDVFLILRAPNRNQLDVPPTQI